MASKFKTSSYSLTKITQPMEKDRMSTDITPEKQET